MPTLADMVSKLESNYGAANAAQPPSMINPTFGQYAGFVQQYGSGATGVNNYAQAVLNANPNATVGDFYAGYVLGTGNPGAFSMSDLQGAGGGAAGAYNNLINNSPINPNEPLANYVGSGAANTFGSGANPFDAGGFNMPIAQGPFDSSSGFNTSVNLPDPPAINLHLPPEVLSPGAQDTGAALTSTPLSPADQVNSDFSTFGDTGAGSSQIPFSGAGTPLANPTPSDIVSQGFDAQGNAFTGFSAPSFTSTPAGDLVTPSAGFDNTGASVAGADAGSGAAATGAASPGGAANAGVSPQVSQDASNIGQGASGSGIPVNVGPQPGLTQLVSNTAATLKDAVGNMTSTIWQGTVGIFTKAFGVFGDYSIRFVLAVLAIIVIVVVLAHLLTGQSPQEMATAVVTAMAAA